jgi:hypothetical protein
MHGMGLQSLFRKALNEQIHIAAPTYWEELRRDNEMFTLVKVGEDKYTVQPAEEQND